MIKKMVDEFFCLDSKFALMTLIDRNLKLRYRKSYLGMVWTLLIPVSLGLIYFIVFNKILKIQTEFHLLVLMSKLLPWTFFASTLTMGLESFVSNHGILNKVPVRPITFTLADTLTSLLNFILSTPVLLIAAVFYQWVPSLSLLLYPFVIFFIAVQAYFLSIIGATYMVYFKDLRHLVQIGLQAWFYLTPVLYTNTILPENLKFITYVNPLGSAYAVIDNIIMGSHIGVGLIGTMIGWTFIVIVISITCYNTKKKTLVENL